jgi:imidazolonepropionase-like amidohydrolase
MVDAHSHIVLPGGSHWIARIDDPTDELLRVAEENGEIAHRAGTRWFRDVGSPERDGAALALRVRDAWNGRRDRPYVRAAGTWIAKAGVLPPTIDIEAADADELVAAVEWQADNGADLIKLYLDGPDRDVSPWTAEEVARAVAAAGRHGLTVTAHSTQLPGARAAVAGGVDCIEHGTQLDADLAADMARRGTFLVPTLGVIASWETFGRTTTIDRFTGDEGREVLAARKESAYESVRLASRAGVRMAAGTDFGGGSLRANHMAWEVECLVAAGLEPWHALGAATHVGGDLLREPTAGRLTIDGAADFFLVHGDPLTDPSALWRVWNVA